MSSKERIENIKIENASILFKNFSGKPDKFNPNGGRRGFSVKLDERFAEELKREGWNIRYLNPREEGEEPTPILQVKVSYNTIPPKVWLITSRAKTLLDEESIDTLDYAEIVNVDLVISPYKWAVGGKEGLAAYVKNMYVTIEEDEFADKYSDR